MGRTPSRRVALLFDEVETLADQLLELKAEEDRLRDLLKQIWRSRAMTMAAIALKAQHASEAEVNECVAQRTARRK